MKIEIRKAERNEIGPNSFYVDDTEIPQRQAFVGLHSPRSVFVDDAELSRKLTLLHLSDVLPIIDRLELFDIQNNEDFHRGVGIRVSKEGAPEFLFIFMFNKDTWKRPWSILEFRDELESKLSQTVDDSPKVEFETEDLWGFYLIFPVNDVSSTIQAEMEKWVGKVDRLLADVETTLVAKVRNDSVLTYFNFPEETRVACEQYLLYFVQFLKDLGVEANAELQQEAGRVLFTVTPVNSDTALDKIRRALEVYLQLPTRTEFNTTLNPSAGIEEQRLIANVSHLNGQLALANAVIQAKNKAIEAQEVTIRQLMRGEVFIQSAQPAQHDSGKKSGKDKEDLLGGAVSLKPYEMKGLDIDLPTIFRRLREMFSQKD